MGVVVYSDGGGERGSTAAGACIIDFGQGLEPIGLIAYLGPGTNNEAEICGGLLAFSYLRSQISPGEEIKEVKWVCDSEYVLKSACGYIVNWQKNGWKTAAKKPVKNQGLWRAFLHLSAGLKIHPEHVRGHTGHPENEACDSAATWARNNGDFHLDGIAGVQSVEIGGDCAGYSWLMLDGRDFLAALRDDSSVDPSKENFEELVTILGNVPKDTRKKSRKIDQMTGLLQKIEKLQKEVNAVSRGDNKARELSDDLAALISKYK